METIEIKGKITCLSPIRHGDTNFAGSADFRKIEMITLDGIREIPYVDGNAIRGVLRRIISKDFFDRVGYHPQKTRLYHFFYAGGAMEPVKSKDEGKIDLHFLRDVRNLLPPISLLGSAFLNQTPPGKFKVMNALPICQELVGLSVPEEEVVGPIYPVDQLLSTTFMTRKNDKPDLEDNITGTQQAIIDYVVLIPGTVLYHSFFLEDLTEVEKAMFRHALDLWKAKPFLGGKSASGSGQVRLDYRGLDDLPSPQIYFDMVEQNRSDILSLLKRLDVVTGVK